VRWLSDDAVAHLRDVAELPAVPQRYRVIRELGRGGMGVVYEVHDAELDRSIALKVLNDPHSEARTIARLEHPGIVPIHDAGVLPDGRAFYTMKLVRGTRLDAFARDGHSRTELLRIFARVCEAVAFAHANGVVHRDLKPENVMVGEFGAVLVLDWGTHVIAGTPGYMAPEQERGAAADPRADVHALGAMLGFLLRAGGERIPRRLSAIVAKATAPDPFQRYANVETLGDDVVRHLDGEPVAAYRENVFEQLWRWLLRYRALLALIAAYLLMRAIVFFWFRL
jgi:eukaryotic-like serine/threonine-protein kinase